MDPRFKSLPFVSVDYKKGVHANVQQQAINLISSSKGDKVAKTNDNDAVDLHTGPPHKKSKHPDETWSVILGPMFNSGDTSEHTSTHEQEVEKEVQKYLAEDLIPINANPLNWWSDNHAVTLSSAFKNFSTDFVYSSNLCTL